MNVELDPLVGSRYGKYYHGIRQNLEIGKKKKKI